MRPTLAILIGLALLGAVALVAIQRTRINVTESVALDVGS
jgi:hypothetical protein